MSSFKHVIDGLVVNNVLVDDNFDVIGMPMFSWVKCKRNEGKIEVRIEEID